MDLLNQLAASAAEVHAATQQPAAPGTPTATTFRAKPTSKVRVEMKSEEERVRKRQLRLLKNRQSAALSRQRKKEYINDLEVRAGSLGHDKNDLEYKVTKLTSMTLEYKLQVDKLEKQLLEVSQENTELKAKLARFGNGNEPTAATTSTTHTTTTTTTTTTSSTTSPAKAPTRN